MTVNEQTARLDARLAPFAAIVDTLAPADPLLATAARAHRHASRHGRRHHAALTVDDANLARIRSRPPSPTSSTTGNVSSPALCSRGCPNCRRHSRTSPTPTGSLQMASAPGVELGPLKLRVGLDQIVMAGDAVPAAGPSPSSRGHWTFTAGSRWRKFQRTVPRRRRASRSLGWFSGALRLPLGPVIVDALASLRRTVTGGRRFSRSSVRRSRREFSSRLASRSFASAASSVSSVVSISTRWLVGIRSGSATAVLFSPPGGDLQRRLVSAEDALPDRARSACGRPLSVSRG